MKMKDKVSLDEAYMQVYLEAALSHWSETLKDCGDEEAPLVYSMGAYEEVEEEGRHVCGLRVTMWNGAVFNFRITREKKSNRRPRKQVTCCDNTTFEGCLTVGCTYEVVVEEMALGDMQMYSLLDDNGELMNTLSWRFAAAGEVVKREGKNIRSTTDEDERGWYAVYWYDEQGERHGWPTEACSLPEALGLFFQAHPSLGYNDVIKHCEL